VVSGGGVIQSDDQTRQAGAQGVWLGREGRVLVGGRHASFRGMDFKAPDESLARGRLIPNLRELIGVGNERARIEPELSLVTVTGLEPAWGGALGARSELGSGAVFYARASSEPRLPSLLDRYASYFGFVGNPGLRPERAFSLSTGLDWSRNPRVWGLGIRALAQVREDAQIASYPGTVENRGWARLQSLSLSFQRELSLDGLPPFSLSGEGTLTHSRVDAVDSGFPLVPGGSLRTALGVEPLGERIPWELRVLCQAATSRPASLSSVVRTLPGYALWDVQSVFYLGGEGGRTGSRWAFSASIENFLDRNVELVADDPLPGRVVSIALTGEF